MAKIDHAAIRTSSYEDAQKFFEDVFDMHMWREIGEKPERGKVSSSVKFLPSTQMQRTDMTTFPLPLILWKKQWKRSKLIR